MDMLGKRRRGYKLIGNRRTSEMQHTLSTAYASLLLTHLYPHSTITLRLHILSQDGSLLAACINAATLALIDAGIPMTDYLCACTAASSSTTSSDESDVSDPLLDLNGLEEQELPFLTVATLGKSDRISVLLMESRVRMERVEGMLAVGIEGCKRIREILDGVVKGYGKKYA
jgi:exosome complex component RRP41